MRELGNFEKQVTATQLNNGIESTRETVYNQREFAFV